MLKVFKLEHYGPDHGATAITLANDEVEARRLSDGCWDEGIIPSCEEIDMNKPQFLLSKRQWRG